MIPDNERNSRNSPEEASTSLDTGATPSPPSEYTPTDPPEQPLGSLNQSTGLPVIAGNQGAVTSPSEPLDLARKKSPSPWPAQKRGFISRILPLPPEDRNWRYDHKVLAHTTLLSGNRIHVKNIRHRHTFPETLGGGHPVLEYFDKTLDIASLKGVDFICSPFVIGKKRSGELKVSKLLAHTMVSFEFADDQFVVVSAEIRKEKGQGYSALKGLLLWYPLMYAVTTEQDSIMLRNYAERKEPMYLYRSNATPEKQSAFFVDMMARVSYLHDNPEWYHSIFNSCNANIVRHVRQITPGRIPPTLAVPLAGFAPRKAFELGMIGNKGQESFEELQRRSLITDRIHSCPREEELSLFIREG